jgi:hypothetical protein
MWNYHFLMEFTLAKYTIIKYATAKERSFTKTEISISVGGSKISFMAKAYIFLSVVKFMMGILSMETKREEAYIIMTTARLSIMVAGKMIKNMVSEHFAVANNFTKGNGNTMMDLVTVTF